MCVVQVVLGYLDKRIALGVTSSRGEEWAPLHMYRNSLVHGEGEPVPAPAKKAYQRKRRRPVESLVSSQLGFVTGGRRGSPYHHPPPRRPTRGRGGGQ